MKTPKSLYSRLALITSVTLVVGYFVVYAAYQTFTSPEYQSGAALSSTFLGKIVSNLDEINGRVTTLEGSIAGASIWSKVGSDINYTAGKVGVGATTGNAELDIQSGIKPHWGIYHDSTTEELRFWNGDNRVVIGSTGNVGIGTVSPGAKLSVDTSVANIASFNSSSAGGGYTAYGKSGVIYGFIGNADELTSAGGVGLALRSSGGMQIATGGSTTRMTIDNIGNVGIGIVPTNGNGALQVKDGVAFPATQVPITNPNTLDDYEEGTWTPVLGGYTTQGTFTPIAQSGFYIKIGRKVTVWFRVSGTVTGASADYLTVNGLPFTNSNDTGRSEAGGSISYVSGLDMGATGRGWFMYPIINSTRALVGVFTQNASIGVNPNATIHLYGNITYYTAN